MPASCPNRYAVKKSHRALRDGVALLRQGLPWTIFGHRFRLTKENGLTCDMPSQDVKFLEDFVEMLTGGKDLLRRCKRRACRNLFVKNRRQEYRTKKCSGWRELEHTEVKRQPREFPLVLNPNPPHLPRDGLARSRKRAHKVITCTCQINSVNWGFS